MPLLEEFEERVEARADELFALFLEEFERAFSRYRSYDALNVESLLRAAASPTVTQLIAAENRLHDSNFLRLIDQYRNLLLSIGMRSDGSGGYHRLRGMNGTELSRVVEQLNAIVPPMHAIYKQYTKQCNAIYILQHRKRGVSPWLWQPS